MNYKKILGKVIDIIIEESETIQELKKDVKKVLEIAQKIDESSK